jgi:hypothetical protein
MQAVATPSALDSSFVVSQGCQSATLGFETKRFQRFAYSGDM